MSDAPYDLIELTEITPARLELLNRVYRFFKPPETRLAILLDTEEYFTCAPESGPRFVIQTTK